MKDTFNKQQSLFKYFINPFNAGNSQNNDLFLKEFQRLKEENAILKEENIKLKKKIFRLEEKLKSYVDPGKLSF